MTNKYKLQYCDPLRLAFINVSLYKLMSIQLSASIRTNEYFLHFIRVIRVKEISSSELINLE